MDSSDWLELESSYAADFKPGISPERNLVAAAVDLHGRMEIVPALLTQAAADALYVIPGTFRPESYGAVANGVTNCTAAIQSAITAAQAVAGTVLLANGVYLINAPLVISGSITIQGGGVAPVWGNRSLPGSDVCPMQSPFLTGTVILQTAVATNAINITTVGGAVHLREFGIRFQSRFVNSGHGIYARPPAFTFAPSAAQYSLPNGAAPHTDNGMAGSTWDTIMVDGHDGNHYAYEIRNAQLCVMTNCQSFGGGGWHWSVDTPIGWYGNSVLVHPYVCLTAGGTASGFLFDNVWAGHGVIYMQLVRPQTFVYNDRAGITPAINSGQYKFYASNDFWFYSVSAPDMEGGVAQEARLPEYPSNGCEYGPGGQGLEDKVITSNVRLQTGAGDSFRSLSFWEGPVVTSSIQRIGPAFSDVARRRAVEIQTIDAGPIDFYTTATRRIRVGADGRVRHGTIVDVLTDSGITPDSVIAQPAQSDRWIGYGFDATSQQGFIQSIHHQNAPLGTTINPIGGTVTIGGGSLRAAATNVTDGGLTPSLVLAAPADAVRWVGAGYDAVSDRGYLQAVHHLTGYKVLALNPLGGLVTIGPAGATTAGDVEITDFSKGAILRSPNNARWRVQVSNAGALTVTAL